MADKSKIEWTDATWNPIVGCSIVSPGCTNCYAMKMALRIEAMNGASGTKTHYAGTTRKVKREGVWTGRVAEAPEHILTQPLRWKQPRRIFVNSMGDLFHESVPDEWIDKIFAVMALAPQHTFQVLTKRAERMRKYCAGLRERSVEIAQRAVWLGIWDDPDIAASDTVAALDPGFLPNVWLGVSAERQQEYDERKEHLRATPAAVRFFSFEPLLGGITADFLGDWVIAGGESGRNARPMHPDWARKLRDDCAAAGVAFFFKQHGEWLDERMATAQGNAPGPEMFDADGMPKGPRWHFYDSDDVIGGAAIRVGKSAAGRMLDGKHHNELPNQGERR